MASKKGKGKGKGAKITPPSSPQKGTKTTPSPKIKIPYTGIIPRILDVDEAELINMTNEDYTELYNFVKSNYEQFKTGKVEFPESGKNLRILKNSKPNNVFKTVKSVNESVEYYLKIFESGETPSKTTEYTQIQDSLLRPIGAIGGKYKLLNILDLIGNDEYLKKLSEKLAVINKNFFLPLDVLKRKEKADEIRKFMREYEEKMIVQPIDSKIQSSSSNEEEDIGPLVATEFNSFEPIDFFPDRRIS